MRGMRRRNTAGSASIIGQSAKFHRHACELGLEGIVSKRLDAPYSPGDRGLWVKTKCLNGEEFVVIGWTDPRAAVRLSARSCLDIMIRPAG